MDCLKTCEKDVDCTHFTWAPVHGGTCWPREGSITASDAFTRKAPGLICGYVPAHVVDGNVVDWRDGGWAEGCDFYESDFLFERASTLEECQDLCRGTDECSHFSWAKNSGICGLKRGDVSKEDAFAVEDIDLHCGVLDHEREEPQWHVIVGGKNVGELTSVEAFNWKTREQCRLKDIPVGVRIHSSAVLDKVPMMCGGFSLDAVITNCYKYDSVADSWEETSELVVPAAAGVSTVVVPNRGWFIFGGDGNTSPRSQRLPSPDSPWELGPELYKSQSVTGTCIVLMNNTHSAFLGGSSDHNRILVLNWRTMVFTERKERLINKRFKSACALVKGSNGEPLVAVAGGITADSKGLEIWNPLKASVELIDDLLPTETASSLGLNHAMLIPINKGTEMILYGGYQNDYQSEIWKFTVDTSKWEKMGDLKVAREEHIIFELDSVACSNPSERRNF